jgi:3-methyladenine DNA glycosylase/8-oxoguanine DNA glycosylase
MAAPNKTQGGEGFLPESRDHRCGDQLRFIARFPAYTTVDQPDGLTWWYRRGDDVVSLDLRQAPGNEGVSANEDVEWGTWVMRRDLDTLPGGSRIEGMSNPHRQLFYRYGGIRPVVFPDPFAGLAWAILGQQITVAFAAQLKNTVAERCGTMVEDTGRRLAVFRSASVLSRVPARAPRDETEPAEG